MLAPRTVACPFRIVRLLVLLLLPQFEFAASAPEGLVRSLELEPTARASPLLIARNQRFKLIEQRLQALEAEESRYTAAPAAQPSPIPSTTPTLTHDNLEAKDNALNPGQKWNQIESAFIMFCDGTPLYEGPSNDETDCATKCSNTDKCSYISYWMLTKKCRLSTTCTQKSPDIELAATKQVRVVSVLLC
jgi:hypothetical protein